MKRSVSIMNVFIAMLIAMIVGGAIAFALGVPAWVCVGTLMVVAFIPKRMPGMAAFAIQKEIWESDIEEAIFPNNSFVDKAFNADQYVLSGKVVHIPQSGGAGNVVKNRSTLPGTIRNRTDTDLTYELDEYTTDPVVIPNADQYELSYDKRNSVLGEDKEKLANSIAADLLYTWISGIGAGSIFATAGDAVAATAPGATGTRKKAVITDLQTARTILAQRGLWHEGMMYALVPSSMLPQLFPANDIVTATYMNQVTPDERSRGIIAKVQGFNIMERSVAALYTDAGVLKAPGAVADVKDCEAITCWYQNAVERAKGNVFAFEHPGDPTMYGDVYSFLCRAGGRRRRSDVDGVVTIKQTWVS